MSIENLSIKEAKELSLSRFGQFGRSFELFLVRYCVNSYDKFLTILYKDIDSVIAKIQANRELRENDGEDRLTIDIVNLLEERGYNASHDKKTGGHVDITVQLKNFTWFGEAKIHKDSYDYLLEGFKQLCTRYTTGDVNQDNGGLIFYIFQANVKRVMERWEKYLSEQKLPDYKYIECQQRPLAFFSEHIHDVSGRLFTIRHIPVMLHFNPKDKSGLKRKK